MNKSNASVKRIKIGLLIGLLAALTGCAAFWGEGYYGDTVMVSEPDMYLFGGDYYRGHDAHNYSHRGSESRVAAHTGGGHSRVAAQSVSSQSRVVSQSSGRQSSGAAHSNGGKGERR